MWVYLIEALIGFVTHLVAAVFTHVIIPKLFYMA